MSVSLRVGLCWAGEAHGSDELLDSKHLCVSQTHYSATRAPRSPSAWNRQTCSKRWRVCVSTGMKRLTLNQQYLAALHQIALCFPPPGVSAPFLTFGSLCAVLLSSEWGFAIFTCMTKSPRQ